MWTWSLNWGEISTQLVVGSCPMAPEDLTRIQREARAAAVLSLQHDDCLAYWNIDYGRMRAHGAGLGLVMEHCPVRDFDVADQRERLPAIVASLARLQADGLRTYVHCTAGLGRSPLAVLGYLTWIEGLAPEDAYGMIVEARPGAVPAWEAWRGARDDLVAAHRSEIARLAFRLYDSGDSRPALEHWTDVEQQVLRSALTDDDHAENLL